MTTTPTEGKGQSVRRTATVEQAAKVLGIGRGTAYDAVRHGNIQAIRIGRRLVVPLAELRRLLGEDPSDGSGESGRGA